MPIVLRHRHRRRCWGSKTPSATTVLAVSLLLTILLLQLFTVTANEEDYYCGRDWNDAAENCALPCPSSEDPECASLGNSYGCYIYTGCEARVKAGDFGFPPTQSPIAQDNPTFHPTPPPTKADPVQFCGESWREAMVSCNKEDAVGVVATPCPNGDKDCRRSGQSCQMDIDCKLPLVELGTELSVRLDGVENTMNEEIKEIFVNAMTEILAKTLEESQISLDSLDVTQQALGDSFDYVELTLSITARYRPSSRKNLNLIVQEYINDESFLVVLKIKQAAALIQTLYFISASGIFVGEGRTGKPTVVPTGMPSRKPSTRTPTRPPTPPPTRWPTTKPTDFPSGMPSDSPSRSHLQSIITSNALSSTVETSYGYLFNIRTTPEGPAIILNGLDFYSDSTGPINYELWSRVGSYDGFRGMYAGWDLIATGSLQGQGREKYTSIPGDIFIPMIIPGGGDSQAFYLSLNTKDLIYQSMLTNGDFSGATYRVQAATPELELYEGEAVLSYPFPNPSQSYLYRAPQEFLGAVHYDRLPCRPFSMFGIVQELPCPADSFPTRAPVSMPITELPTGPVPASLVPTATPLSLAPVEPTPVPTVTPDDPTSSPVESPTVSPTSSHAPTASFPPTNNPTLAPVVPIRANLVMTLRNVPDGEEIMNWEVDALNSILVEFLNRHTGKSLVVDGVDLWDQQLVVLVDDGEWDGAKTAVTATARDAREDSLDPSSSHVFRGVRQGERDEEDAVPPTINALRLILILRISFTTLPPKLLGTMAVVTTQENHDELLEQIQELGSRYMYFANISGVDVFHIETLERLTSPPTGPPIEMNTTVVAGSAKEMEENGSKVGVIMGAVIGCLWVCLCAIGIVYMRTARSKMLNSKDADNLSKSQQDPIKHDPTLIGSQRHSSRTVPTGASHAESDADGSSKIGISKSLTTERPREQVPTHSKSLVVTSKERERMLENSGGRTVAVANSIIDKKGNRKATQDRRSMLSRSDSQIAIDTSILQSSIAKSERIPNRGSRPMLSRSDSQLNISTAALAADFGSERGEVDLSKRSTSSARKNRGANKSFTQSVNSRQNNNLSKSLNPEKVNNQGIRSLVDTKFEEVKLLDESLRSTDNLRSSSRRPTNLRGDRQRLSQSMKVSNADYTDILLKRPLKNDYAGHQSALRKSQLVNEGDILRNAPGDLRGSGTRGAQNNGRPTNLRGDRQRLSQSMKVSNADYTDLLLKRPLKNDYAGHQSALMRSQLANEGDISRNAPGDLRGSGTRGAQNNGLRRSGGESPAKDANDLRGSGTRGAQNNGLRRSGGESSANDANDLRGSGTRKAQTNDLRRSGRESSANVANDLRGSGTRKAQNNDSRRSGRESSANDANDLRGSGTRKAHNNDLRKSSMESSAKNANDLRGSGTRKAHNSGSRKSSVDKPLNSTVEDNKTGSKLRSSIRQENQDSVSEAHAWYRPVGKKQNTDGHDPLRQSEAASTPSNADRFTPKKHSNNVGDETSNGKHQRGSNDRHGNARGSRKKMGSSDAFEGGYRETAKRTARKKASANVSRSLNQIDTQPRIGASQSDNFEKGYREVAKHNARNQASQSENRPLSQSATTSRMNHQSMQGSANGSRTNSEISSLRQSRVRGSAEDMQRLVKEARKQTSDSSQSLRRPKVHGEMASLRPSSRHDSLDESTTSRDEPRVTSRTKSRPASFHDSLRGSSRHDNLDKSATSRYEPRVTPRTKSRPASSHDSLRLSSTLRHASLDKSATSRYEPRVTSRTKASPASFTASTPNQSAIGRTERHSKSMLVAKDSDMAALRKSTTRGDDDLTDVRQAIRKRRDEDFADQRRAVKHPVTRRHRPRDISEQRGMFL